MIAAPASLQARVVLFRAPDGAEEDAGGAAPRAADP
jgi:hypothetical protein